MVKATNISVTYKDLEVFKNLSFTVCVGEKVAITGASGAGKSTILSVLNGYIPNFKGDIELFGLPLNKTNIRTIRSKIAWLPQDISLPFATVEEMIFAPFLFAANKHNKPTQLAIYTAFDRFMLPRNLFAKKVNEVSGGQLQRILLAVCLFLKKELILLDEPVSALDEKSKKVISDIFLKDKTATVIAAVHDTYWAENSDKVLYIK